ncbi:MAG: class I tRNA ligase family protein, partial [Candidatus Dojkabacteria bacterium]
RKMSKTIGNVISPTEQLEKFGYEPIRFYMLSELPTFGNSSYSESDLKASYNSKLADNFGNLLNRVIHLSNKKNVEINNEIYVEPSFKTNIDERKAEVQAAFDSFDIKKACDLIFQIGESGNKYIQDRTPWSETDEEKVKLVLNNLGYLLDAIIDLYEPIIPDSCAKAKEALDKKQTIILFEKLD